VAIAIAGHETTANLFGAAMIRLVTGLCDSAGIWQWRSGVGYHAALKRTPKGKFHECTVDGCGRAHYAKGLCGRHYKRQWPGIPVEGSTILGEAHGKSKLTDEAVRQIRMLHNQGWSYGRLGKMFDVSADAVRDSVRGRTWKHIWSPIRPDAKGAIARWCRKLGLAR